jgi:hypothetical protein
MSTLDEPVRVTPGETHHDVAPEATPDKPVVFTRRRIDIVLIGFGVLATVVFAVAGGLLLWGANFADDYVYDELSSQRITFPDEEALLEEGRDDLVKYAGQQLDTGKEAEAYASFIDGHLANTGAKYAEPGGEPLTYAELGGPERAARAAVTEATEAGAPAEEIAALQAESDQISADRNTLFKGETLRGLLLSAYAWSTVGRIAGFAAIAAFVAAALMAVLVVMGVVHYRRMTHNHA